MNKLLLVFSFIMLTTYYVSCSNSNHSRPTQLCAAIKEMERDPQLSLKILNNIKYEMPDYNKRIRMEYELLLVQALDKTNQSLANYKTKIDSLVEYYKKEGTDLQRAKSFYYMGGYYRDKNLDGLYSDNNNLNALHWYKEALKELNDETISSDYGKKLAAAICSQISALLYDSQNYTQALIYSLQEYNLSKTPISKFEAASDLAKIYTGIAYMDESKVDSVIKYYDIAFQLSKELELKGPTYQSNLLLQTILYIDLRKGKKTEERLRYLDLNSFHNNPWAFYSLGKIYEWMGKTDSALYFYKKTLKTNYPAKVKAAYYRLMKYEYERRNWKAAAEYGMKYKTANDSAVKYADAERVSANLGNFEKANVIYENERLKEKAESTKTRYIVLTIFSGTLLCIILIWTNLRVQKYRTQFVEENKKRQEIEKEFTELKNKLVSKTDSLKKEMKENEFLKGKLREYKEQELRKLPDVKDYCKELEKLILTGSTMPKEMLDKLPQIVATVFPKADQTMKECLHKNPMYAWTLGLFLLGYRNTDISRLTNNTRANISSYCKRLYKNITGKEYSQNVNFVSDIKEALSKESES